MRDYGIRESNMLLQNLVTSHCEMLDTLICTESFIFFHPIYDGHFGILNGHHEITICEIFPDIYKKPK